MNYRQESLKKHAEWRGRALALHHGHPRLGANVAEPKNGGAVGFYRHGVPPAREREAEFGIVADGEAGLGYAGGVRKRESLAAVYGYAAA